MLSLRIVCDTNTTLDVTSGSLRTMPGTNSSLPGSFCECLVAAGGPHPLRFMPLANSALDGLISSSLMAATIFTRGRQ